MACFELRKGSLGEVEPIKGKEAEVESVQHHTKGIEFYIRMKDVSKQKISVS